MENVGGEIFSVTLLKPLLRCHVLEAPNKCWSSSPLTGWCGTQGRTPSSPMSIFPPLGIRGLDQYFRHSCWVRCWFITFLFSFFSSYEYSLPLLDIFYRKNHSYCFIFYCWIPVLGGVLRGVGRGVELRTFQRVWGREGASVLITDLECSSCTLHFSLHGTRLSPDKLAQSLTSEG